MKRKHTVNGDLVSHAPPLFVKELKQGILETQKQVNQGDI